MQTLLETLLKWSGARRSTSRHGAAVTGAVNVGVGGSGGAGTMAKRVVDVHGVGKGT